MNKRLNELKMKKEMIENSGLTDLHYYKFIVDQIAEIEAVEHYEFMMRGDRSVVAAIFDKMGIKLAPEELREFRVAGDPLPAEFLKGASEAMDDVRKGNRSPYIRKSSRKGS